MENKVHYKLYKSGKIWVIAGITALSIFVGTNIAGPSASADTVTTNAETVEKTATTSGTNNTNTATDDAIITPETKSKVTAEVTTEPTDASTKTKAMPITKPDTASTTTNDSVSIPAVKSESPVKVTTTPTNSPKIVSGTKEEGAVLTSQKSTVKSGIYGTSKWDIDDQGNLNIHAGTLGDSQSESGKWDGLSSNNIKFINIDKNVVANTDSKGLFSDASTNIDAQSTVEGFNGLNNLDTSNVTAMNEMFMNLSNIKTLDLSHFNTSKVTP